MSKLRNQNMRSLVGGFSRLLIALLLSLSVLPALVQAAAAPTSQDAAAKYFGEGNLPDDQYYTQPRELNEETNWRQVSVGVCRDGVSPCTPSDDPVIFKLAAAEHHDSKQGQDSWDYIFTPNGDKASQLKLVYRYNTKGDPHWGLVYGDPGDGVTLDNQIAGLEGLSGLFQDYFKNLSDEGAIKQAGIPTATQEDQLGDRPGGDAADSAFVTAFKKLYEMVGGLNRSIVEGLIKIIDLDNLNNIQGLSTAWKTVRDIVNLLFLLVLVAMALLTIVRVEPQKYSIRGLLPMLIFGVVAVNFSLLAAAVLTNSATVLSQPLAQSAVDLVSGAGTAQNDFTNNGGTSLGQAFVLLLAAIIMLIALFFLLIFFVVRIIVIWLLAALSPIIFLAMVLPLTRGEAKKMLESWVKWVYMAPIAFLILYIGAQMLPVAKQASETADSGGTSILLALFYAGIIIAAVMIPIGLGGQVMRSVSGQTTRAGKVGGKGGLGLAGMVPLPGAGMSLGQGIRTGRAAFKQRSDAQQRRAEEAAGAAGGELHRMLGGGGLAQAVTGRDLTQAQAVTEGLVDEEVKQMQLTNFQRSDAQAVVDYAIASEAQRQAMRPNMTPEQLAYTESYIGRRAAAKKLAQEGFWDTDTARHFGHTGYQALMEGDPFMKHIKRRRYGAGHDFTRDDYNTLDLSIEMSSLDGDGMRKLYPNVFRLADPSSPDSAQNRTANDLMTELLNGGLHGRNINATALRQNVDTNHRNVAAPLKRQLQMDMYQHAGDQVKMNLIAGNLAGKEWTAMPGLRSRAAGEAELARLRRAMALNGRDRTQ